MTESGTAPLYAPVAGGPVEIVIPAEPALSRVVRLAASGLASLTGFTLDEIEDIKIAVSEVMIALVEHGDRAPIMLDFAAQDDAFVVRGRTAVHDFDPEREDLELCRTVLDEVCAEHGLRFAEGHAEIWASVNRTV
jgi:hypothetical protein